jgi:hypothetical protein
MHVCVQYVDAAEEAVGEHQEYYEDLQAGDDMAAPLHAAAGVAGGVAVLLRPYHQEELQRMLEGAAARRDSSSAESHNTVIIEDVFHEVRVVL